jgi:hypothetical protein
MIIFNNKYSSEDIRLYKVDSSFRPGELESKIIDAKWAEMLSDAQATGKRLWDEPCARIESIVESSNELEISISTMPFSSRRPLKFLPQLMAEHPGIRPNGGYVQCFVMTSDGYYVFGVKSANYSTDVDHSFIGGVYNITSEELINPVALAKQEVVEELGVKPEDIDQLVVIGAYHNSYYNTGIVCAVSLRVSKIQVAHVFSKIDKADSELSELTFVKKTDIRRHITEHISRSIEACDILEST